jgi:hypothetical protein
MVEGAPTRWPDTIWVLRRIRVDLDIEGAEPADLAF